MGWRRRGRRMPLVARSRGLSLCMTPRTSRPECVVSDKPRGEKVMARAPRPQGSTGRRTHRHVAMAILTTAVAVVGGPLLVPAAPAQAAPCADPQTSPTVVAGFEI